VGWTAETEVCYANATLAAIPAKPPESEAKRAGKGARHAKQQYMSSPHLVQAEAHKNE